MSGAAVVIWCADEEGKNLRIDLDTSKRVYRGYVDREEVCRWTEFQECQDSVRKCAKES